MAGTKNGVFRYTKKIHKNEKKSSKEKFRVILDDYYVFLKVFLNIFFGEGTTVRPFFVFFQGHFDKFH
jgi:hypothetical protein